MAYVAVTQMIKDAVSRRVRDMYAAERDRLHNEVYPFKEGYSNPDWVGMLELAAWKEHYLLVDTLPREYVWHVTACDVNIFAVENGPVKIAVPFSGNLRLPPPYWDQSNPDIYIKESDLPNPEVLEQVDRYNTLVTDAQHRYSLVAEHLDKFLTRCKSVNEALALMPDLKFYLPEETVAKVEAKRQKKEQKTPAQLENVDVGLITSAVVLNHLTSNG